MQVEALIQKTVGRLIVVPVVAGVFQREYPQKRHGAQSIRGTRTEIRLKRYGIGCPVIGLHGSVLWAVAVVSVGLAWVILWLVDQAAMVRGEARVRTQWMSECGVAAETLQKPLGVAGVVVVSSFDLRGWCEPIVVAMERPLTGLPGQPNSMSNTVGTAGRRAVHCYLMSGSEAYPIPDALPHTLSKLRPLGHTRGGGREAERQWHR